MSLILPKQTVTVTMSVPLAETIWSTTTQTITMEAHIHVVSTITVWIHILEDTTFAVFPNQTVTITRGGGRD